ncbi:p21-activated protein kinase-interacting protein 1-like [Lolium rigidum]|uniref:p21-activated protein kinase-interacting protein 1-like n=1 Tax=Lolium rigidum TaxID=89674 RepID=UPI001F5CC9E3|nr:p21-activated protein kinase-interacting protein 1-like [Lolium rigidum]
MALIAGSYERFIWGFSLKPITATSPSSSDGTLALAPLFSYPAHAGPIRCVAAAPRAGLAASGGADDSVRLYDLPTAADLGPLLDPCAAVSALAFHSIGPVPRNLLAASDDGLLHLYDADGFALLSSLRVFPRGREAADAVAVHPSGRVALAVGRAGGLAMLNLLRGRRSFACRLERPASAVAYAEDAAGGDRFVMAAEEKVTVHDSEDARIIHEMRCDKRVLAFAPAKNGVLYTGGEDRGITAWDLSSGKVSSRIEGAHSTRVKGIVVFDNRNDGSELSTLVASASSDGVIRIWDARMTGNEKPTPLAEVNTKARITCLAGSSLK